MGFFDKKKKAKQEGDGEEVRGQSSEKGKSKADAKNDAAAERARLKKIRAMKKKFDETVWENVYEVIKKDIPQFTMIEKDPDVEGGEAAKHVLLGFDTRVVDDFTNKADDDVGSILSAIKHSMDVVIEEALFDNELILVVPTPRSLAALAEFEETFELKFFIVYVTEDHRISMETRTPDSDDDFITITLPEVRDMLDNSIDVRDKIHELQVRIGEAGDYGGLSGKETSETATGPADDDDVISEDEYDSTYGSRDDESGPPDEEDGPPDEDEGPPDEPEAPDKKAKVTSAVGSAVASATQVSKKLDNQKEEAEAAKASAPEPAAPAQPARVPGAPAGAQPAAKAPAGRGGGTKDRIARLAAAAQAASDTAKQDTEIKQKQAAMTAPQKQQFDMQAMDKYVIRKYYSDDLGLEISSEPFDAMFLQSNPFVPFQEVDSDGWLDGYVNNLRRDANVRLSKLHYENLLMMRQRFVQIVTDHCSEIVKAVSTDDPASRFGWAKKALEENKKAALEGIPAQAESYKQECEAAYQGRMKAEIENASNVARANFINRYAKEHEREMREIETDLRNNLEAEYMTLLENLHDDRRKEAKRQLDLGISEALRLCKDEYVKMIAMEHQEYARLQAMIVDYMNEHMAADEAKTVVMMEDQRRGNEIARLQAEHAKNLEAAVADFEARVASIRGENEQAAIARENAFNDLKDQQAHTIHELRVANENALRHKDDEIAMLRDQLSKSDDRLEEMTRKFVTLEEETEKKYSKQIGMIKSERDAWDERAQHIENVHKYTDKIKFTSVAVGFAAMLAVGIIIGCVIMAGSAQRAVDKALENAAAAQNGQPPEVHYFIDDEEVDLDSLAGGEGE